MPVSLPVPDFRQVTSLHVATSGQNQRLMLVQMGTAKKRTLRSMVFLLRR